MRTFIVWADQIGNFIKDADSVLFSSTDRILVIGDTIKVEAYKALETRGVPFQIEQQFAEKEDCEVFLLGTVYKGDAPNEDAVLVSASGFSKKAKDIAAKMSIEIVDMKTLNTTAKAKKSNGSSQGETKRKPKEKSAAPQKESVSKEPAPEAYKPESKVSDSLDEKAKAVNEPYEKKRAALKEKSTKGPQDSQGAPFKKYVKRATIMDELGDILKSEMPGITTPGTLSLIEDSVKRATDAKASLEFQLKMNLGAMKGNICHQLAELIAPHFDELKKKLEE